MPDLARRAVVDDRAVEPGNEHVRGTHACRVDAKHLGGRQLRERVEVLVRHEAVEALGPQPLREPVEPLALGLREERPGQIDAHGRTLAGQLSLGGLQEEDVVARDADRHQPDELDGGDQRENAAIVPPTPVGSTA